jgi:hypothetical protein
MLGRVPADRTAGCLLCFAHWLQATCATQTRRVISKNQPVPPANCLAELEKGASSSMSGSRSDRMPHRACSMGSRLSVRYRKLRARNPVPAAHSHAARTLITARVYPIQRDDVPDTEKRLRCNHRVCISVHIYPTTLLAATDFGEPRTFSFVDWRSTTQIRECKCCPAVATVSCAKQTEQRVVFSNAEQLTITVCPTAGLVIVGNYKDLANISLAAQLCEVCRFVLLGE